VNLVKNKNNYMEQNVLEKARIWLNGNFDEETKQQVRNLIDNDPVELTDAFYRNLEFGTGGLRGIMGVGTNRMNKYTVAMSTQGLANYLKMMFDGIDKIKVAIAHDSRNNSKYFARITAEVLSANGIKVFLFEDLRPTPELSYAVRYLKCQSGIVLTASHNPKEYNGYKVYWDDGAQLVNPHDENVITEVQKIESIDEIKFEAVNENIEIIGKKIDDAFIAEVIKLRLAPEIISKHKDIKIVYTPLHGTGITMVPRALKEFGFENVHIVQEQAIADGNFPTIKSPNPEEPAALAMAIEKAVELDADIVMATDPDADREGVAVKDEDGNFILLNGNQTAAILSFYLIKQWNNLGKLKGNEYIVKTIVTTELIKDIADKYNVECYDCLTGFKYIAAIIRENEGKKTYLGGGEESYGYLPSDFVRDKDAITTCCILAEMTAFAIENGKTFYQLLLDIYQEFGLYYEGLLSVTKKGKSGLEEIQKMMDDYRAKPPAEINGSKVVQIKDYLLQKNFDLKTGRVKTIELPKSNVLQFLLEEGTLITVRPSGTEPKIKFYFGLKSELRSRSEFNTVLNGLKNKIESIKKSMGLS
jgi:phosphoglucomutase